MVKKTISAGNNFFNDGNYSIMQGGSIDEYYYTDNLMDIFDRDSAIKRIILNDNTDFRDFINSPEYKEKKLVIDQQWGRWWMNDKTGREILAIQLELARSIVGDKYDQLLNSGIQTLKEKWAPAIDKITNTLHDAENWGQAEPIAIKDKTAVLDKTYLLHNIPISNDIEGLKNRKELGILASE